MAKDNLGREMAPGTPAAAYNAMSVKAAGDAKKIANEVVRPAMQRGFPGVAAVAQGAQEDMAGQSLPRQAGTLVRAVPAAAVGVGADVLRSAGLASKAVFGPYMNAASEFGRGLMGPTAAAAPATVATAVKPAAPVAKPESGYVPGAGLPSKEQIASDRSRIVASQQTSDRAMGIAPAAQPTNINVTRQPNGVLSFSGVGGGDGTGAVRYSGMPNWTSKQGGAGMGAADFGGEAFKPAQAEIAAGRGVLSGEKPDPMMNQFNSLMDAIGRGEGGPVGVAQNKIALQALAPLLERQMAGKTSTEVAKIGSETQRRGQDLGLKGEMARVGASVYGTDVGAETADKGFEVEKQKAAASIAAARAKAAAGKPTTMKDKTALFVFAGLNADGTPRTPEQQAEVERRYASSFGNRDSLASLMQAYQTEEE